MYSTFYSSEESHPPSRPRPRPWSPDPRDPVPSLRYLSVHQHQRHEVSDPSIEAFDLADYARTLNRNPYDPYEDHLSSPPPPPTRSFSLASHTSSQPPSLVSSGGTPTSHSHSTPPRRDIDHRLFTPSVQSPARTSVYDLPGGVPYSYEPLRRPPNAGSSHDVTSTSEIDITHFPSWSHGWYAKEKKWSPIGQLHEPSRASFFDPAHPTAGQIGNRYDTYAATLSQSSRDFVPWSDSDAPDYDSPLDPELKQERIRMLEHEFGSTAADPVKQEPIGSVNEKGRLITDGPRKRTAIRAIEVFLAVGIAAAVIYAALWIKPPKPPPPQSKPHTLVLYALSILTALFCLYLFFLRPCFRGDRKRRNVTGAGPSGLAVLPIQELQGDKKKKKKGKKGKQEQGNVQVNLIVDPTMFGPRDSQDDEENANPDEHLSSSSQSGPGKRPKRRSVFEGLALEEQWKQARKDLKWMLFYDAAGLILWSVEFVWILIRERCPPGGFDGWCNAYNVATAGSCLLGIAFGMNVFFDVKDLHQSRISPRTRT
ncbi:hypothetical protein EDB87DRAFT_192633 [Lactarius vividus]|nr:hypothetical protein EDB87DRAFT_192633 [Lactarius vividus]